MKVTPLVIYVILKEKGLQMFKVAVNPMFNIFRTGVIFGATCVSITVILPWIPTKTLRTLRDQHEFGHSWGIVFCEQCVMYESGDNIMEKFKAAWVVLKLYFKTGEIFCPKCISYLERKVT